MRLLGYTCVSEADQDAAVQFDALMSVGVEPINVFSDIATSKATDRPGMRRLLEAVEGGETVVVWRIDRLGGSLIDVLDTVTMLGERGINLRSVQDGIDPSITHGRLMLNLLGTLAEYDRHLASERIAAGMASARKSGTRLGRPPLDPVEIRDKIRAVEEERARGRTASDAAQLVGWSRATFYRHLQQYGASDDSL